MNITEKLSLGKTLKVQRVLKDMSVQEVITPKSAGISASTYDNIESGRTKSPSLLTLKKIANVLDMEVNDLTNLIGIEE